MAQNVKKTIVLVGMMGAGKTAVGQAVAHALSVPFLDSDQEIRKAANMEIADIFARDGEAFFRDRETEVITRLLETERCVLSTGGGAFLTKRNREVISRAGVSVWLRADLDLLWQRVRHKDTRPLLRTSNPFATLSQLYHDRVPVYALADMVVEARPEYSITRMSKEVIRALRSRPDVIEKVE
ncbi:MAG: shikimate kinase [Rhodobacteraceae bacterium]|nr:shikimate kinase [Paracoccaceae bacterium]